MIKEVRNHICNSPAFLLTYVSSFTATKSLQSCPTLCDPRDGSPPGSPVPGILQARTLERVAISFSNVWKWKVKGKSLSHVWLFATPWTAAPRLLHPWDFPGKSTGVGCHCLLHLPLLVIFISLCIFGLLLLTLLSNALLFYSVGFTLIFLIWQVYWWWTSSAFVYLGLP